MEFAKKASLIVTVLLILATSLRAQNGPDTLLFKNKWIILTEHEFIKKNQVPTESKAKYEMMKNAVMDSDSTLFSAAVLYRFLDMTPDEIIQDPFNEIIIIDINKDGKNDVVFYLSPEWDAYSSVFWVFINDGNKYHEYLLSSGIITHIDFDEKGYKRHFTYFGKCCMYSYQIRSEFHRQTSDSVTNLVYQTLSNSFPDKLLKPIEFTTKNETGQYDTPEISSLDTECSTIPKNSLVEIVGEKNEFWYIRYPVNDKKKEYYLVWIPKQLP